MDTRAQIEQELAQRGYVAEALESPIRPEAGGAWALTFRVSDLHKSDDPNDARPRSHTAASAEGMLSYVRALAPRL